MMQVVIVKSLDDVTRWWIVGRLEAGHSQAADSRDLGVPRNLVSTLRKHHTETEIVVRRPGQGRIRATMPAQDRCLRLLTDRDRPSNIVEKDHYDRADLADEHTDLHVFDRGTLIGQQYRDEILVTLCQTFSLSIWTKYHLYGWYPTSDSVNERIPQIGGYSTIGLACGVP
ncbi:HTH_Tnp_Tc3_2 domain-containing protein [Trichonephila clavipes]|nr:HTH_Tnp_Tc3_2 domain-containing protein [Trichonephila clavipes]